MKSNLKTLRAANLVLRILIALGGVAFLAAWMVNGEVWKKPASYAVTILLPFVPDILRIVFKLRISEQLTFAYEFFLIVSMVMGIDFDMYRTFMVSADGTSMFDKIVHAGSGVLTAFVAKEILDGCYDGVARAGNKNVTLRKYSTWFTYAFILGFVALVAVGWECFEFSYDQITGGSMQQLVSVGVDDTMWDMISALGAGVVAGWFLRKK